MQLQFESYVCTYTHIRTHSIPSALRGPLKWLVINEHRGGRCGCKCTGLVNRKFSARVAMNLRQYDNICWPFGASRLPREISKQWVALLTLCQWWLRRHFGYRDSNHEITSERLCDTTCAEQIPESGRLRR